MKSIIVCYSYSGNTRKTAGLLKEYLLEKGEVETIELKDLNETGKFFTQAAQAFKHVRANIPGVNFNLSGYDLVCFGSPVWAFGPAPAMNTYLDKCFGLEGKDAILFTTYGSGAGNQRCLKYMQAILAKKGVKTFKKFSLQQYILKNEGSAKKIIKGTLESE
jgi:flavodoxin